MKTYTFYWLDGKREVLTGTSIANAFSNAGYGAGALRALDFVMQGEDNDYVWDNNRWTHKYFVEKSWMKGEK